ncbi:unnamed protein product [Tuber melanosporum]|uniref:(Perigord truffle) hypothetical protein n=1 Tax=Tuber melanosporum (strain Mel28) TaxID=656061 RepID=D5GCS9_TUBMM|nr:uncharacterized protein GSTUM_00006003001 [Tuber melanosporum]CAZ82322.1 unnamed protein product [Tuber melanosporum]
MRRQRSWAETSGEMGIYESANAKARPNEYEVGWQGLM